MENIDKLRNISRQLRWFASRTRTHYGGSDFCPVDWKTLTGSPEELLRLVDELDAAIQEFDKP